MEFCWEEHELSDGDAGLFLVSVGLLHGLIPPGARLLHDEGDGPRVAWRHTTWDWDAEDPPVATIDRPRSLALISTREVVEMLPAAHHDFVRQTMARQIQRADMFGRPPEGGCLDDEHAQLAGRTLAWITRELEEAFPGEGWFLEVDRPISIPATVDEFLDRLPAARQPSQRQRPDQMLVWLRSESRFLAHIVAAWLAVRSGEGQHLSRWRRVDVRRWWRRDNWQPPQSSDLQAADIASIKSRLDGSV